MKKIIALALTVVMVLGLMAGCQKPMDAATLAQKMDEAAKGITAMAGKMGMELDMSMAMPGMTLDVGMNLETELKYAADMSAGYMKGKYAVTAMGTTEETEMESYIVSEGDQLVNYTYDSVSDMWLKTGRDVGELKAMQESLVGAALKFGEIPAEKMTLAQEQETVGGKACYVLTVNMDGDYFLNSMETIMNTMGEELAVLEALEAELMEGMDWSKLNMEITYHVDAASFQIVQMEGQVQGIGEMFNGLLGTVMGQLMLGAGEEELEMNVEVPICAFYMSEMAYNDVEIPAVPQEAIDNAVTEDELMEDWEDDLMEDWEEEPELGNPPQADGSFLMQLGETSVRITVPERYVVLMSEVDFLDVMTEDYAESVICMMVQEYTHDDMLADFQFQVQMAKEEERWLSDEITQDASGFTVGSIIYNDSVYEVTGWKEIEGNVVAVSASSFEYLPQIGEVLGNIVIGE